MPPASQVNAEIPAAPQHLPAAVQKQWQDSYAKAHAQAKINHPEDASAQRRAATKAANAMLTVPAPEDAEDIDDLEDWQVLTRGTRTQKDGTEVRHCVTSDGRKYAHPVPAKKAKAASAENKAPADK